MLKPNNLNKLSARQARSLLSAHAYWYRHYSSNKQRHLSVKWYRQLVERDAENMDALGRYLESASYYATEEQARDALEAQRSRG